MWNNILKGVESFFSPSKTPAPVAQSQPIAGLQFNTPAPANISKSSFSAPASSGVNIQKAVSSGGLSKPSGGSSGGGSSPGPSPSNNSTPPTPSILNGINTMASNIVPSVERATMKPLQNAVGRVGSIGSAGATAANQLYNFPSQMLELIQMGGEGNKLTLGQGGDSFFNQLRTIAGTNYTDPSQFYGAVGNVLNKLNPFYRPVHTYADPSLQQGLSQRDAAIAAANSPAGKVKNLPTNTKGQTGVTPSTKGVIPSPLTGANKNMVPSAVSSANLPANMQGLNSGNTNPALTSQVTPEAMRSLGQMLLRSILGNQSSMNSMSPQLAQALWGAPTAGGGAFGGYNADAAVPSQTSITPSKNIPLPTQPLAMG